MRKLFTLAVAIIISVMAWSVTPEKMSYQAVIRNSSEQLVVNKKVGMRISILQNSETGTAVYTETQTPTTNTNGLVSLEIGAGKSGDNFSAIDWSKGPFFIKTETDLNGGTNYTIRGVSQLLSVPYALQAKTVEIDKVDDADADPSNEIQTLSLSGTSLTLSKNGGTVTLPSSGGGDNWGTQTVATNTTLEGNGSTASPLKIAQQGATSGQTLKWNGSAWAPGDDAEGTGLTLPYSKSVSYPDFAFTISNSYGSGIEGGSSEPMGIGVFGIGKGYGVSGRSISGTGVIGESFSEIGTGVFGVNQLISGKTYGVKGVASSSAGVGVYGENLSTDGNAHGVEGVSYSGTGAGVYGCGSALNGVNYGVNGSAISPEGVGVYGHNDAKSGNAIGIKGESSSKTGTGVLGIIQLMSGKNYGVKGIVTTPDGAGISGENLSPDGNAHGVEGVSYSETGTGVYGYSSASKGLNYGVKGESYSSDGTGVYGTSPTIGVKGVATDGVGFTYGVSGETQSPSGIGVSGVSRAADGATMGVYGVADSPNGYGVYGYNSSQKGYSKGVYGKTNSDTGAGVYGTNDNKTGHNYGVMGEINSTGGTAVYGENWANSGNAFGTVGVSYSPSGVGTYGGNGASTGLAIGVKGESSSSEGTGVSGTGGRTGVYGTGSNYGVYGEGTLHGVGVHGIADSYGVEGVSTSSYGAGVYGWGSKYGIYAECPTPTGYAGYFSGKIAVTGNVGIGTIDSGYKLDVNGETNTGAININCNGKAITCNGKEAVWYNGDHFSWGYDCVWNAIDKKVFIGPGSTDPGGNTLVVNGAAAKPGGGSWATWSDIRLKDIQGNYEKGLKEIIALKPVKFNYKAGNACNLPSDQNYVGFIAQDVQKIFPEAVSEGKDGYLSLDVNAINVALVNAIKELKSENDKLKAENKQFEDRLSKIEKMLGEGK